MMVVRARPFTPLQRKSETSLAMDTPVSGASHNHDPDRGSVRVTKAKANLKSSAAQTREKPGHLFPMMSNYAWASKTLSRR